MSNRNHQTLVQLLNQALQHHQAGRLGEAAAGYQQILNQNPKHSDALHLMGVVAQQMDKLDMAIELMKAAIAVNPSVAHYHHNLGNTYLKNKQAAEAVQCYRQAILLKSDYFEAHFGMGNALAELNQFEVAAQAYQTSVKLQPRFAEGYYNLGRMLSQLKKLDAAIACYRAAVELDNKHPEYFFNLGSLLLKTESYAEAIDCFQSVLAMQANDTEALCNLGAAYYILKDYVEGEKALRRAVAIKPDYAMAHLQLGALLSITEKSEEAQTSYETAIQLDSSLAEAFWGLGNLYLQKQNHGEAEKNFREALKRKSEEVGYHRSLAQSLLEQNKSDEAIESCESALAIDPSYLNAYYTLGQARIKAEDYSGAEIAFRKALEIDPRSREAWFNLGGLYQSQFRFPEAIDSYRKALEPDTSSAESVFTLPIYLPTIYNLGICLLGNDQVDKAINCYQEALDHHPDDVMLHNNLAVVLLKAGRLVEGWDEMEWRWKNPKFPTKLRDFGCPMWHGEPLDGKKIFLHMEQGYGDILQMVRYIPLVAERGGRIILESPPSLRNLLCWIPEIERIIITKGNLPEFDYHCPLMSLPRAFRTSLDTIPAEVPYLSIPKDEVDARKQKWPGEGLRVGLVWSGNPEHYADAYRSMHLRQMIPLGQVPGVTLYSLQVGSAVEQIEEVASSFQILDVCSGYTDFADTAAFISGLDLVITVDTSVAHLSGALGIPVWILLAYEHVDWRWLLDREDSPWYPSARLFRQERPNDWTGLITRVQSELNKLAMAFGEIRNSAMVASA